MDTYTREGPASTGKASRQPPAPAGNGENVTKLRVSVAGGIAQIFRGRTAWALDALIRAGDGGCSPLEKPALRWADYVHKIRKAGISVETIDERHGGAYSGTHARYVLRSPVTVIAEVRA